MSLRHFGASSCYATQYPVIEVLTASSTVNLKTPVYQSGEAQRIPNIEISMHAEFLEFWLRPGSVDLATGLAVVKYINCFSDPRSGHLVRGARNPFSFNSQAAKPTRLRGDRPHLANLVGSRNGLLAVYRFVTPELQGGAGHWRARSRWRFDNLHRHAAKHHLPGHSTIRAPGAWLHHRYHQPR